MAGTAQARGMPERQEHQVVKGTTAAIGDMKLGPEKSKRYERRRSIKHQGLVKEIMEERGTQALEKSLAAPVQ